VHVLGRLGVQTAPTTDVTTLGRQAAHSIRQFSRPFWLWMARLGLLTFGLVVSLGIVVALLALVSPAVRARVFPTDLGLTARYKTSSTLPGIPQEGVGTYARGEVFFHTNWENRPHIDLNFGRPVRVRKVRIENRQDCCGERSLPLDVKAIGKSGERFLCQRRAPFDAWTCQAGGVRTSRIRIEVPGPSMLHLRSIEVYE